LSYYNDLLNIKTDTKTNLFDETKLSELTNNKKLFFDISDNSELNFFENTNFKFFKNEVNNKNISYNNNLKFFKNFTKF
jgi:hypothetical protein